MIGREHFLTSVCVQFGRLLQGRGPILSMTAEEKQLTPSCRQKNPRTMFPLVPNPRNIRFCFESSRGHSSVSRGLFRDGCASLMRFARRVVLASPIRVASACCIERDEM